MNMQVSLILVLSHQRGSFVAVQKSCEIHENARVIVAQFSHPPHPSPGKALFLSSFVPKLFGLVWLPHLAVHERTTVSTK